MNSNARAKVLVVEDSLAVAKRLQISLERVGFLVETARNGREAVSMALKKKYDVVITDEQMPIMSGREFCRRLRSDSHYQHTPVIFLTAKDSDLNANELRDELGVRIVFGKPFNPSAITHVIEKELQPCSVSMLKSQLLDAAMKKERIDSVCTQGA